MRYRTASTSVSRNAAAARMSYSRPGQLPLERLSSWQQEARHEPARQRVPPPLPAAAAATRLRSHPQLRLPRQPPTSHADAALLQPGRRGIRSIYPAASTTSTINRSCEVSALRRNHALAISRIDEPDAMPREMSSRSANVSVRCERRRTAGAIPPCCDNRN
jgi:hypothetical protein